MIASVACFHYQINTQCSLAWFFTTPWQQSVFPQESTLVCAVLHVHSCLLYFTSFCVFVHKPCAISMCFYSMRALLIHLCRSLPRVSLSPAPLLPHTPSHISSSGWANHRLSLCHPHTCMNMHTNTHTHLLSLPRFFFFSFVRCVCHPTLTLSLSLHVGLEGVSNYNLSEACGALQPF